MEHGFLGGYKVERIKKNGKVKTLAKVLYFFKSADSNFKYNKRGEGIGVQRGKKTE
ncbi:MAG: hypothetical protein ACKVU2_02005 [Saprospiraceae bacterium]